VVEWLEGQWHPQLTVDAMFDTLVSHKDGIFFQWKAMFSLIARRMW
jgi:hypothetical protein